jgi:hypothetical protein
VNDESNTHNSITLRRIASGYTWNITVHADGQDHLDDLRLAVEQARQIDDELSEVYVAETNSKPKSARAR